MSRNSNPQPAHIKVDLPVYGDICSILFPKVKKGSTTEWYVVWSSNQTLCDRYEAAQYDACELRTELVEFYGSTLLDCSTTKWTAPAMIHVPAASITDYYPRPDTATGATPIINMDKFWWLIPLPFYLGLFVFVCSMSISFCYAYRRKKRNEQEQDEDAASERPPLYPANASVETEDIEKAC